MFPQLLLTSSTSLPPDPPPVKELVVTLFVGLGLAADVEVFLVPWMEISKGDFQIKLISDRPWVYENAWDISSCYRRLEKSRKN
jgi:hypothetical protein